MREWEASRPLEKWEINAEWQRVGTSSQRLTPFWLEGVEDAIAFCLASKHGRCHPHSGASWSPVGCVVFFGGGLVRAHGSSVLQFPCSSLDSKAMWTVSSDLVALNTKRLHEALASIACSGPGPQRLSFLPSDFEPTRACLREGSEEWSKNMLCQTLSNCWVPPGEKGFLWY